MNSDRSEPRSRREIGVLTVLILVAFGLRLLRLGFQPLWWDEGYSVWFAAQPLGQMLSLTAQDIHPPLYYALLHGWTRLLGFEPTVLRVLSVVIGTLTIPLIYLAARRMLTRRAALLAAFLLTINPLHVYYSQEVRMYGLVALLSTAILAAAWRLFDTETRRRGDAETEGRADAEMSAVSRRPPVTVSPGHRVTLSLLVYILLTTAALYTQYYAVFLPVGLTLYALWRWRRNGRAVLVWLGAQAAIALLYLPWVLYAAPKLVLYVSQKVVQDADRPLGALAYLGRHLSAFLSGHLEGALAPWWPAALVPLVPLAVGWILAASQRGKVVEDGSVGVAEYPDRGTPPVIARPHSHTPIPLLATVTLTALALGWLISLRYPFFPARGERLLLLALPPFLLLAAAGLDALWLRWRVAAYVTLGFVVATSVAGLAAFYIVPRYPDDDYRPLIARTVEQGLPEDTVFAVYPWQVGYWRSYGSPNGPAAALTPDPAWGPAVSDALDAALARGRVWFPAHLALGGILETQAEAHLAGRSVPFVNEWYGPDTRLSAWAALFEAVPVDAPEVRFPLPGSNAGSVELAGTAASLAPAPAANAVVPLSLRWRAEGPPPVLDVSVRLTDDLGQIWAQHDYEPLGGISDVGVRTAGSSEPIAADQPSRSASAAGWQAEDRLGLLIPAGTPPGRYKAELLVRPKGSEQPLAALGADGQPLGTAVPLLALEVVPAGRVLGPERLPIGTRAETPLGDGLRLLGYTADGSPAAPGDLRKVSLFWQADQAPAEDYVAFVQLLDRSGRAIPLWEAPPGAAYPTGRWAPGTLMRTQAAFHIPAGLPDGRYRLIAGLFRPSDGARLKTPRGGDYVSLGNIDVRGRAHDMNPPQPGHPAEIDFGGVGRLVGYDLDLPAAGPAPGGTLDLTLHWQALAPADRAYTVFVHLLDEQGNIRGYGDSDPGRGRYPTTGWLPGEYLADRHTVTIAPDAQPGAYRLAIGLYDPATGERLKTAQGADQTVLETPITVRR